MNIEIILKENKKILENAKKIKFERDSLSLLLENIKNNQSTLISGIRQIGKTTIMKQALAKVGEKATYFTISSSDDIEEIENIINKLDYDYNRKIIMIDEVQNITNWHSWIIDIYNKHSSITFIVTGSASIVASKTTGSIRFREIHLSPLSLKEYVGLNNEELRGTELLNKYMGKNAITGMSNDSSASLSYAKRQYFDTYVFSDIQKHSSKINISELSKLLNLLAKNTSGELLKKDLIKNIWKEYDIKYVRKLDLYLNVLIEYNVITVLKRKNLEGSWIRNHKYYINPHLFLLLNESTFDALPNEFRGYVIEGLLLEQIFNQANVHYIKQKSNSRLYANQEVDFVIDNKWIEVKSTDNDKSIIKQLNKLFLEYNKPNLKKSIISFSRSNEIKKVKNINIVDLLMKR